MSMNYAGGETRDYIRCKDCATKRRPLKWCDIWLSWMCPNCTDARITAAVNELT